LVQLIDLLRKTGTTLTDWQDWHWGDLHFAQWRTSILAAVLLLATALIVLLSRSLRTYKVRCGRVGLPAILPGMRWSWWSMPRHGAFVLFVVGIPFFALALADPLTAFTRREVSHPGRRIAVMIDASTSMMSPFSSSTLHAKGTQAYFTTVAAAEYFVKLRMQGPNRDLISLIEFGTEAYVVTPFTTDYQNILLSTRLIGDWDEWQRFPDPGTVIVQAIHQGLQLFRAFDFLNASGNLLVLFTDGDDTQAMLQGRSLDSIMAGARENNIPVYMVRMAYSKSLGEQVPDAMWKAAIQRTGGRFYAAANEETIISAVREIDKLAPGRIDVREYTTQKPRFAGFALIAVGCWLAAAAAKLGLRYFRTFP
jgi:Mg-chelatase subunit ChlD